MNIVTSADKKYSTFKMIFRKTETKATCKIKTIRFNCHERYEDTIYC